MQVRVRVELPDSPGALARLAHICGEAYVNILSVRVYPGLGTVTDDLILEIPDYWSLEDARDLVAGAGGHDVWVIEASRGDLEDDTTRWLQGALSVLADPARVDDVVGRLMGPVGNPLHAESERIAVLRRFAELDAEATPPVAAAATGLVGRIAGAFVRTPGRVLGL